MYIYIYVYIYVYIYIYIYYIYIYIYIYICVCVCVFVYVYINAIILLFPESVLRMKMKLIIYIENNRVVQLATSIGIVYNHHVRCVETRTDRNNVCTGRHRSQVVSKRYLNHHEIHFNSRVKDIHTGSLFEN